MIAEAKARGEVAVAEVDRSSARLPGFETYSRRGRSARWARRLDLEWAVVVVEGMFGDPLGPTSGPSGTIESDLCRGHRRPPANLDDARQRLEPGSESITVRELLDRESAQVGGHFQGRPQVVAEVREAKRMEAADELGWLLRNEGRLFETETYLSRALADRRRTLRPDHPDTLRSVQRLYLLELDRGNQEKTEPLVHEYEHSVRCAFGSKHPENVVALKDMGRVFWLGDRLAEAETCSRRAAEAARRILGPGHPLTLSAEADHARVVRGQDLGG